MIILIKNGLSKFFMITSLEMPSHLNKEKFFEFEDLHNSFDIWLMCV